MLKSLADESDGRRPVCVCVLRFLSFFVCVFFVALGVFGHED